MNYKPIAFLIPFLALSTATAQQPNVAINSALYYRIGGARSITAAPNPGVSNVRINGSLELGLGYSCAKFNPSLSLSNFINNLSNAGNSLVNGAISAVSAAISAFPMLILQRANPGLYDLFQSILLRGEAAIQVATASCQEMERKIQEGKNPFEGWRILAKFNDWKTEMTVGGLDIRDAEDRVESSSGRDGLPWLGGVHAGGLNQEPIRPVQDTVIAGYNSTLNRSVTDRSPAGGSSNTPLTQNWSDPDDAAAWARDVIGDTLIRTDDGHISESEPGHGLLPKIEAEREAVENNLSVLVFSSRIPTREDLMAVSAPGVAVTGEVINALRSLPTEDRLVLTGKLVDEVAMARQLEKAMMIRQLLLTGRYEPNIAATEAGKRINEAVATLDQEIENLLFEKRVRKEMLAETSSVLLELRDRRIQTVKAKPAPNNQTPIVRDAALEDTE